MAATVLRTVRRVQQSQMVLSPRSWTLQVIVRNDAINASLNMVKISLCFRAFSVQFLLFWSDQP